jgi:hypothetical protein
VPVTTARDGHWFHWLSWPAATLLRVENGVSLHKADQIRCYTGNVSADSRLNQVTISRKLGPHIRRTPQPAGIRLVNAVSSRIMSPLISVA